MKYLLVFAFALFCTSSFAQQPFEGTIHYRLHAAGEKDDAELVVSFGANRIRVEFLEPHKTGDRDYFLVALDSGKVYNFDTRNKTYRERWLKRWTTNATLRPSKIIAGHPTTTSLLNNFSVGGIFINLGLDNTILYTANDLYFPVPEKFSHAAELMMVQNGRIVLGAEFSVADQDRYNSSDTAQQNHHNISAEATAIVSKKFTEGELSIPAGFHKSTADDYLSDSTAMIDSVATATDPVITTTKHPSKPKNKKNGAKPAMQKGQAVRRKKQ